MARRGGRDFADLRLRPGGGNRLVCFSHTAADRAICSGPSHPGSGSSTTSAPRRSQAVLTRSQPIKISLTEEPANKDKTRGMSVTSSLIFLRQI